MAEACLLKPLPTQRRRPRRAMAGEEKAVVALCIHFTGATLLCTPPASLYLLMPVPASSRLLVC